MNIQDIKSIITNYLENKLVITGTLQQKIKNKINRCIRKDLENKYNCKFTVIELIFLLKNKNNLNNLHIFCECGNKNCFRNLEVGYGNHCSDYCVRKDKKVIAKRTINMQKTKQIRYGNSGYVNLEKRYKTCEEKYGCKTYMHTKEFREKSKYTNIKNLGTEYALQNKDVRKKCYKTRTKDGKSYIDYNKSKLTMEKHYGKNYRKLITNKIQQSTLKNHGVKCIFELKKYRDKLYSEETKKKRYETMLKNKSYNRPSKPEDKMYNLLLNKFIESDIRRPFRNKLYPFKCDFYIKSLDLYIECHFSQFHQGKPFDTNSKQDWIKLLCLELNAIKLNLKEKDRNRENQYERMIYTWTDLDVRKFKTAKENNLNYITFYNWEQFYEWFSTLP